MEGITEGKSANGQGVCFYKEEGITSAASRRVGVKDSSASQLPPGCVRVTPPRSKGACRTTFGDAAKLGKTHNYCWECRILSTRWNVKTGEGLPELSFNLFRVFVD
jgi:hypothetical protein